MYWQGNVRQLENVCHWLTVMSAGKIIQISDLPNELKNEPISEVVNNEISWQDQLTRELARRFFKGDERITDELINQVEKILIQEALKSKNDRKIDAAKLLGIGRNTITRKIKELIK